MKDVTRAPGIYVHIPFCLRKCNYCAFLSFDAGAEVRERYVESLIGEIALRAKRMSAPSSGPDAAEGAAACDKAATANAGSAEAATANAGSAEAAAANAGTARVFDTIYFGGGTPTVLSDEQLRRILDALYQNFHIDTDAEVTLEANPGTVDYGRLVNLRKIGFNRLSMGVQSMDDERLKYLGRIHDSERVREDYAAARAAGFDNINLDIIFSVPGESTDDALADIREIAGLGPEHISFYSLQLEEGTPFYLSWQNGEFDETPEDVDRETYHRGCQLLAQLGYEHYEISNFCKPGYESRHNSKYWNMAEYLGLGLVASGFLEGVRYRNEADLTAYEAAIRNGEPAYSEEEKNALHDDISEAVFTGLRRFRGITYAEIGEICGACGSFETFWEYYAEVRPKAEKWAADGFMVVDAEGMRLTEAGMDVSNRIMAEFV